MVATTSPRADQARLLRFDGVERALARASELETLVHNEVAQLERAYNDNELRIRGLIEDLASQRDILVGQAEQVRNAIAGVHLGLTQDISSISEMVASSVNEAAQRITRTLAEKGEHITLALGRAVLAADIEGNRSLIEEGVTGLLFRDEDELEHQATRLVLDPVLRARLGSAGRELVERCYPPAREIEGYLEVYRGLAPVSA